VLAALFAARPMWRRRALEARPELLKRVDLAIVRRALVRVAYRFKTGPWAGAWARFGYDPRSDPQAVWWQARRAALSPWLVLTALPLDGVDTRPQPRPYGARLAAPPGHRAAVRRGRHPRAAACAARSRRHGPALRQRARGLAGRGGRRTRGGAGAGAGTHGAGGRRAARPRGGSAAAAGARRCAPCRCGRAPRPPCDRC
jgi:hypothetical protein